jgi:hypothetical protein
MLEIFQFIAVLSSTLFTGAAIYGGVLDLDFMVLHW